MLAIEREGIAAQYDNASIAKAHVGRHRRAKMRAWLFVLAEVMDKEPAAIEYWTIAALLAAASFFAVRWCPWAIAVALPVALLYVGATIATVDDPCSSAAILYEAGGGYVALVHATLPLVLLGPLVPVVRADLPIVRAWWSSITSRRSTTGSASAPYRASAPAPPAVSLPWRLLLVFITVAAALVAFAFLQRHRILHRCVWEP